jgi:hypothetical protein
VSFSGADPDALADYAAQAIDAADSLRPVDQRLATVAALLKRAAPGTPKVTAPVDGFARLGRRTRELGERVGTFGCGLRDALGGPSSKVPMTMDGLLFPNRAGSPPRPVGWERWSSKDRGRYLRETDADLAAIRTVNPWSVGRVATTAGKSFVNAVAGTVDGVLNTATFGAGPDVDVPFTGGDEEMAFAIGRFTGTTATAVVAGEAVVEAVPALAGRTAAAFAARRGVDAALGVATEASLHRGAGAGDLAAAGLSGGVLGGVLDGAGQAYTSWRIAHVEVPTISHGFDSIADWQAFSARFHDGFAAAGWPEAAAAVQGSGATGRSFRTGVAFDVGRTSDLDVAVASDRLLAAAQALGVELRTRGMRTAPIGPASQRDLGVYDLLRELSGDTGRPVKIMVYRSLDDAVAHKPSIPLPRSNP